MNDIAPRGLMSPPSATTDSSVALFWDKPESIRDLAGYQIFTNGMLCGFSLQADYTVEELEAHTEYEFSVRSMMKDGTVSQPSQTIRMATRPAPDTVNVTDFGAVGDGKTVNTAAIQKAIAACPPDGRLRFPPGTYLSGAIYLKGSMTLFLEKGSTILGTDNLEDYPLMTYRWEGRETLCYSSLINVQTEPGERLRDITIEGPGMIDANGSALRPKELKEKKGMPGRALCLRNTDGVYLKDITVKHSPAWCTHLIYCENVSVNGVKVRSKKDELGIPYRGISNGDGLNPDSCRNVYIFNSLIDSQDDCIAIKSGRDAEGRSVGIPTEHVRIANCEFFSGFGVAVGSEMSGGVRDVIVRDCRFTDTFSVGTIKAPRGRGAVVEDIHYENLTLVNRYRDHVDCEWFRGAINVDLFYSHVMFDLDEKRPVTEETPHFRNISFENIVLSTVGGNAIYIAGLKESPIEDIRLKNIHAFGVRGLKAYNVKGLLLENVQVDTENGSSFEFREVSLAPKSGH